MELNFRALVLLLVFAGAQSAADPAYPPEIRDARVEFYRHTGDADLRLWIIEPDELAPTDKRPAVVFFFGGGWTSGSPGQFERQARYLASRGMVTILADYRVYGRHGTTIEAAVSDADEAIKWIRQNAGRLRIDADRIAAAGGSSGGHLAAAAAMLADNSDQGDSEISHRPDALVLFNPVLLLGHSDELTEQQDLQHPAFEKQIGNQNPYSLSPYHFIQSGLPATIIFHGSEDSVVPLATIRSFSASMRKAGNSVELVEYQGQGHGFFNYGRGDGTAFTDSVERMDRFFVDLGWLSAAE